MADERVGDGRLLVEDVDRRVAGAAGVERGDERTGLDQPGAGGVDEERIPLHQAEVAER